MTSEIRQPIASPATLGEYLPIRPRMIDTHGRPVILENFASTVSTELVLSSASKPWTY